MQECYMGMRCNVRVNRRRNTKKINGEMSALIGYLVDAQICKRTFVE
jgi:hypothetical protein